MLSLRDFSVGYEGRSLVSIPAFDLPRGEHGLILGCSGSGKTTLLYAIGGLLPVLAGTASLDGELFSAFSGRAMDRFRGRHFGLIHQTLHMAAPLSVRENLLLPAYAAGLPADRARADKLLDRLGLASLAGRKPAELSHGQRQRVAIARAAMLRPRLILGDEPTSALDDAACDRVMELLLEMAAESGASLLLATHDARITRHFRHVLRLDDATRGDAA